MSIDTVVSIIVEKTAQDGGIASFKAFLMSKTSAEWQALAKSNEAQAFFRTLPAQIAAWTARLKELKYLGTASYLRQLAQTYAGNVAYEVAVAKIAAEEAAVAHAARVATANAAAVAAEGTLVTGAGTIAVVVILPIVGMAAVAAALGSGYYEARQKAQKEGYAGGFIKGFVMGLLKWELRFVIDRFWDRALSRNNFDEQLPTIAADAHNRGLLEGRAAGLAKTDDEKKQYLKGLRLLANPTSADWTSKSDDWREKARARLVQTTYVIELANAAIKSGIIAA